MHNKFFSGVLTVLSFIVKIPLFGIRYFCIGLFFTMYYILSFLIEIVSYFGKGVLVVSLILKQIFFYLLYGISTPLLLLIYGGRKLFIALEPSLAKQREKTAKKRLERKRIKAEIKKKRLEEIKLKRMSASKTEADKRSEEERKRIREMEIKKAQEFIAEENARKRKEHQDARKAENGTPYVNKKAKRERNKIDFSSWFKSLTNQFKGLFVSKNKQKEIERQVLPLDFEGEAAKKSDQKILFIYEAKAPNGKVVKDFSEAFSKVEVHSYLLSEGYEVYSIKKASWLDTVMHKQALGNATKFKTKDLIFLITQLSTYLKAGITLVEALRILSRQYKKKGYKKVLESLVYNLTMGDNLSDAMDKQGEAFPRLLINMVKTAEMTGELPEVLDDMAEYYSEMEQTRKQMISALTYPSIVFVFAIAVITFMLVYVIPQFTDIYASMEGVKIPGFTLFIMAVSAFLRSYSFGILLVIIAICVVIIVLYKNIRGFRAFLQYIMMHIPVIGNTIIYNEVTNFTKTFASLLAHSVFITDSMDILLKVTNNEIYKDLIANTVNNLSKGEKISEAFKDHWAFPLPAYEMLVTGETTGELPEMMKKVSTYYQMLHKDSVNRIKTFIEPILTVFLTVIVGAIILAIIIPMFGMYQSIQQY